MANNSIINSFPLAPLCYNLEPASN